MAAQITGTDQADTFYGSTLQERILGFGGDDTIFTLDGGDLVRAGGGSDSYIGGSGFDTLDFSNINTGGVILDVSAGQAVSGVDTDIFNGFERFVGTAMDDSFDGNSSANIFLGGAGDDMFRGRSGVDTYTGGDGQVMYSFTSDDLMQGGVHQGIDVITDFSISDTINLVEITQAQFENLSDAVRLTVSGNDTVVSVLMNDAFVDVVRLAGFVAVDPEAMASDGMFLF